MVVPNEAALVSAEDRALLSAEQRGELEAFERMFASAGWHLMTERFAGEAAILQKSYDVATDIRAVGYAQGARVTYGRVLKYPDLVAAHFSALAREAEVLREGGDSDSPETDDDWA